MRERSRTSRNSQDSRKPTGIELLYSISHQEARKLFAHQHALQHPRKKRAAHPNNFSIYQENPTDFVVALVPLSMLEVRASTPEVWQDYAAKLSRSGVDSLGPIWVTMYDNGKFFLGDGNHRAAAARSLRFDRIPCVIPRPAYEKALT